VSLIIPHHNQQAALSGLLDSVLAQRLKELEVVLVDDCSDTSCKPLVEAYRNKGLDINLISLNERVYSMKARLVGMQAARADIIGFAEVGDILWGTEALERNVRLFLQEQPDILHFKTALVDSDGKFHSYTLDADPFVLSLNNEDIFTAYITSPNFSAQPALCNKLLSRHLCIKIHSQASCSKVLCHSEHFYLTILAMFHARKYIGSQEVGYGYYQKEPKDHEIYASAVTMYHTLQEITLYLEKHLPLEKQDCHKDIITRCTRALQNIFRTRKKQRYHKDIITKDIITRCTHALQNIFCAYAEKLVLAAKQKNDHIPDANIDAVLEYTDEDTLLELLLLGNYLNTQKISGCLQSIYPPMH